MARVNDAYALVRHAELAPYAGCFEGEQAALAIISAAPVTNPARDALIASALRLGYAEPLICWIDASKLDPEALFRLTEALDPLALIVTDESSVETIAFAYHARVPLDGNASILGRPCALFSDFAGSLGTQEGKRQAWHRLKALPTLS